MGLACFGKFCSFAAAADPHNLLNMLRVLKPGLAPGSLSRSDKEKSFKCLGCFTPDPLTSLGFSNLRSGLGLQFSYF